MLMIKGKKRNYLFKEDEKKIEIFSVYSVKKVGDQKNNGVYKLK